MKATEHAAAIEFLPQRRSFSGPVEFRAKMAKAPSVVEREEGETPGKLTETKTL